MGLTKTSGGQGDFLAEQLRALAQMGDACRVLVSGSADYSMPAHALWSYRTQGAPLELQVVDRCETPLALSRWYAARYGAAIDTHRADILEHRAPASVDVVFTNSFFGSFDPGSRPRLIAAWRRLLRPGGTLLFTNRLRAGAGTEAMGFDADQARSFTEAARHEAEQRRDVLGLDAGEAARRAQAYAERYRSYPLRSVDEIAALLKDGDFTIDLLEVTTHPGRRGVGLVSGPSTMERADYARVRATRR